MDRKSGTSVALPTKLAAGLHFIATPIGAARDITLRALDILTSAEVLAAEDTRSLRHLMEIHGVALGDRPLLAYHDHNGARMRPRLLRALAEGKTLAYASEAGTPLVADPGYQLARAVIDAGYPVFSAPGPSAVLAALTVSGLPSDRFFFAGFAPTAAAERRRWLAEIEMVPATIILYESPKRVSQLLGVLLDLWGDRQAVVCRELTKKFEEICRGSLVQLAADFADRTVKGEIVVLLDRRRSPKASAEDVERALRMALRTMTLKDATATVAAALAVARRDVYQAALALEGEE